MLAVVVVVVAVVVVYLVKEKLEHWLNCVKIVRKLAYLISFFSVCESSKLNPCGEKVSAPQTTPGTVLDVNVTLVTKEYRVVSVENLVPIGTGDTSFLLLV